jgi:hypothetical protein
MRGFRGSLQACPETDRPENLENAAICTIVPPSVNIENVVFSRKKVPGTDGFMEYGQNSAGTFCRLFVFFTIFPLAIISGIV